MRSSGGYRLYDAGAVPRLDLVRTLRELGLDLDAVRQILSRQASVADVASAHARALDAEIRILQIRRCVLRVIARRGVPTEEMTLMHKLAMLSAPQRQQIIDDFVAHVSMVSTKPRQVLHALPRRCGSFPQNCPPILRPNRWTRGSSSPSLPATQRSASVT